MNKKTIVWAIIIILIVVSFGYYLFLNNKSAGNIFNYYCQEGNFKAQFGKNYVVLTFSDGKNMLLPQTVSGSGIRYELGTTTFVSKGENAFITEMDKTTYTNCVSGNQITKNDTNLFTISSKVFSFSYPSQFKLSGGDIGYSQDWSAQTSDLGLLLAVVNIPRTFFAEKTNFSEAKFTVGMSADMKAISNCLKYNYGPIGNVSDATIDGTKFTKMEFSDAGAGNFYETTSYRTIHDDFCYVVEYTIHSTNIHNYSPDQGVVEFDKAKVTSVLEKMVQSFKFI